MHIRFKQFTQDGHTQFHVGDLLLMSDREIAQRHIDDGNAVEVKPAEYATVPHHEFAPAYPTPAARKPRTKAKK